MWFFDKHFSLTFLKKTNLIYQPFYSEWQQRMWFYISSRWQPAAFCSTVSTISSTNFSVNRWSSGGVCPSGRKPFIWFMSVPVARQMNILEWSYLYFCRKGTENDIVIPAMWLWYNYVAWFAMVILLANPKLAKGLFWEIFFWNIHTLPHELDTFLWIFIKLGNKGGCLTKELGEMAP